MRQRSPGTTRHHNGKARGPDEHRDGGARADALGNGDIISDDR